MKYGFIGCGNMGGAIASALATHTNQILISDPDPKAHKLAADLGCQLADNIAVASQCDRIFLAVKPQILRSVLQPLSAVLTERRPLIITMAAGIEIFQIEQAVGTPIPVIRIMPNTPVAVGKGMILYCHNNLVSDSVMRDFLSDMSCAGVWDYLPEHLIDAASALSGSGPAYLYVMLEALADGAVACGIPRKKAMTYAAATMAGAAEMFLSAEKHPGELKDAVCSPGGSTIAGIRVLEEKGFRGAIMDCVIAAYQKNLELGK